MPHYKRAAGVQVQRQLHRLQVRHRRRGARRGVGWLISGACYHHHHIFMSLHVEVSA